MKIVDRAVLPLQLDPVLQEALEARVRTGWTTYGKLTTRAVVSRGLIPFMGASTFDRKQQVTRDRAGNPPVSAVAAGWRIRGNRPEPCSKPPDVRLSLGLPAAGTICAAGTHRLLSRLSQNGKQMALLRVIGESIPGAPNELDQS